MLPNETYRNHLSCEECSNEDYELVQFIIEQLDLKSLGDYHVVYLYTDVLAFADVFQSFRDVFFQEHHLDVARFASIPSTSLQHLKTKASIELVTGANCGWHLRSDINRFVVGGL